MTMEIEWLVRTYVGVALVGIVGVFLHLYNELVKKQERVRTVLRKQGINGPPPTFLLGNILEMKKSRDAAAADAPVTGTPVEHNCSKALFPFFQQWQKQYGEVFTFSLGNTQVLHIIEADMVREMSTCTSLEWGKPWYQAKVVGSLLGQGLITSSGATWAQQRKIIAPELYKDKVKGMMNLTTESAIILVNSWKSIIEAGGGIADIKIDENMRNFSGDVISRACFGSNYAKGEEIFLKLRALTEVSSSNFFVQGIPGIRYLPTKSNREAKALKKEIRTLILKVVKERKELGYEKDLLQMILEVAENSEGMSKDEIDHFIVDNCKTIHMAGYETVAVSATWCLMLLASNPEWQDRVRAEVLQICQGQLPDDDMILKMKQLTMVIYESLRLYPPGSVVSREALKDMKLGNVHVPKGVVTWMIVPILHTHPEIWGQDSYKFNPNRFANGISGACKFPYFYMPFGAGPRVCIGQYLALVELKILIALILSNFSFSLSPKYVHSPAHNVIIEPKYGVNLLVKKLS